MNSSDMNHKVIREIAQIMQELTGILLQDKQYSMMESRLTKRMYELNLSDFDEYLKHLKGNFSTESKVLITLLTTHHTSFFREFVHFEYLLKEALPKTIERMRASNEKKIRIWSAGCSTGQEIYSLAMFLDYHLPQMAPDFDYEIFGTDIDIGCIKSAKNGVYRYEQIKEIPAMYQGKHWQRGTGDIANFVRISEKLRKRCLFMTSNLFDTSMLIGQSYHLIFCRNVFLYFNQAQIDSVTKSLLNLLSPSGYLFLGLSESLSGSSVETEQVGPSVFHKMDKNAEKSKQPVLEPLRAVELGGAAALHEEQPAGDRIYRVVCVDDSTVILSIMKKILVRENGFEVVATAPNGLEAKEVIEREKPDIVTMDIHMPLMTGVEYLQSNMHPDHPPVVMVSSVSREDADFGLQSLELGAVDFIEKPSLINLQEKAKEICFKLKTAIEFKGSAESSGALELLRSFQSTVTPQKEANVVRFCVGGIGDLHKIKAMLSSLSGTFPPFVILLHGGGESFINMFTSQFKSFHTKIIPVTEQETLKKDHVYIATLENLDMVKRKLSFGVQTHIFVVSETTQTVADSLMQLPSPYLFLEERASLAEGLESHPLKDKANEVIPFTSMVYHSNRLVANKAA